MSYPYQQSMDGSVSKAVSKPVFATEKGEQQLADHLAKAVSPDESAPKQKHCIIYSHDLKSTGNFIINLKAQPISGNDVLTWKCLVVFHKVLNDAQSEKQWLDTLTRQTQHSRGYGVLIKAYVQYIIEKLNFHYRYPSFLGNFDYEEYLSLRGVEDPNEGYETIDDLITLLDKLDAFQKLVLNQGQLGNECRMSVLVPLVEESYGIYQFLVSMLTAMHMIIGSVEVLGPLRDKFQQAHYALFQFYAQCSQIKYVSTLITIPRLSKSPPDFLSNGPPTLPSRKEPKQPNVDFDAEKRIRDMERQRIEQERMERQQAEKMQAQIAMDRQTEMHQEYQRQQELQRQQMELQRQLELQRQQESLRQQEEERLRGLNMQRNHQQMQHMEQQMLQQRFMELSNELENFRSQSFRDKNAIDEAGLKMRQLENQLAQLSLNQQSNEEGKDDIIRNLQDELNQWKQKYEALAKLYAQLRKEHLDLLTKFKDAKDSGGRVADDARKDVEKIKAEMRAKNNDVTNILIEKDRLKSELDRIRGAQNDELARLTKELQDAKESLLDMSKNKGAEVQSIIARFNAEKSELENQNRAHQRMIEELRKKLDDSFADSRKNQMEKDEEGEVLQTGLDQTLIALANLQKTAAENEERLLMQLRKFQSEQSAQVNRMMDNILQSCIVKIEDSVYELESSTHEGNRTASPEYVLSLLEKTHSTCGDFAHSFVRLVQGGDQSDAITASNAFAHSITQLLVNAKGASRLAPDDENVDSIINIVKEAALSGRMFFEKVKFPILIQVDAKNRPDHINSFSRQTQNALSKASVLFEKLVSTEPKTSTEEIGDLVEQGMLDAARAIEEAARRLEELMNRPTANLQVHGSILSAALAITNAIANLIKCASASQKEIVAHGKGTASTGAFYKKNNKWSEGLLSAARAVAHATTYLVEGADGLICGTHSVEQLIVAANEVGVSTTQLVAAARVKAIPFSKTQDKLEDAAVLVREATKLLVKAAKEAAKSSGEKMVNDEMKSMSGHQFKVVEMEQQVKILELEKDLQNARYKLASIRKAGYSE